MKYAIVAAVLASAWVSASLSEAAAQPDRVALMQAEMQRCQNKLMPTARLFATQDVSVREVCSCESQIIAGLVTENQIAPTLTWLLSGQAPPNFQKASGVAVEACFKRLSFQKLEKWPQ